MMQQTNNNDYIIDESWKTKFLIIGAVMGALAGAGAAYLLTRTAEEQLGGPPQISTTDAIRAAVGIVGTIRGIASLGGPR